MANEPSDRPPSLMTSVTRMLDSAIADGANFETIIHVLTLLCLVSILSRTQPAAAQAAVQAAAPAGSANPLHKLLGDLSKGDGGPGPDALLSLLPLLNNPQIKSKINPATIGTVLSLLNSMGDKSDKHDSAKAEKADKADKADKTDKGDKVEKSEPAEEKPDAKRTAPVTPSAATATTATLARPEEPEQSEAGDRRSLGRYLNWKTNF